MKTVHIIVSGCVQGVCFRAFTEKQAIKLGILGFVKNCDNGTVEIVACAEKEALENFINCCHKGPLMAKVKNLIINDYGPSKSFTQFDIY
jgi:acylphosphatase